MLLNRLRRGTTPGQAPRQGDGSRPCPPDPTSPPAGADQPRVVIFIGDISPYRVPFLNELEQRHPGRFVTILSSTRGVANSRSLSRFHFRWEVAPSLALPIRSSVDARDYLYFGPGALSVLLRPHLAGAIFLGWTQPTTILGLLLAKLRSVPAILWETSIPHRPPPVKRLLLPLLRRLVGSFDAYVAASTRCREYLVEMGAPGERIFLLPNVTDHAGFEAASSAWRQQRAELRESLGLPAGTVALFAGQLVARKGIDVLLRSIAQLTGQGTLVNLLVVGQGELEPTLRAYCNDHGLADRVRFLGYVPQADLPRIYAAADIFVLPSRYDAFGMVINEAMASGLPVITTSCVGAVGDLVRDGQNGIVVPPDDVDALAAAIGQLCNEGERRSAMGDRSRTIIAEWTLDRAVDGLQNALSYSGVLPAPPAPQNPPSAVA